ncbi:MAG: adenosylcobalamin-dependent ribonucleoside-diphosphate reductase [Thermodesulfovibrionales bacterium]|nr:adenosylcobalamin-dependent ribonucleoside-diphosphate reductase [Thermodesulfovibrionales bacterium]
MHLSEIALKVLETKFLLKDEEGRVIETPEQMFRRVARHLAKAESLYSDKEDFEDKFYELMSSLRFLPNSPALMNANKPIGQLAACFVLPVEDSMEGIFSTLKNAALILQSGGGTGFSFSRLRPNKDIVRSTTGVASGPVSFMKIFDMATEVIKQGGARKGANMGILNVNHPDIIEFIRAKRNLGELNNFNISVAVTDDFMEAVKNNDIYNLINPRTGKVVKTVKAKEIFKEIVISAWQTGDPGLIFIDKINRANPTPHIGYIESTNPCGEQPLLPYEACILGSFNLTKYLDQDAATRIQGTVINKLKYEEALNLIKWDSFRKDIHLAVRLLDNAIDVNVYPVKEVEIMHKGNRKIGIGVMGWADLLINLFIPYGHAKSFRLAEDIMKFLRNEARKASISLAQKRGVFPNFKGSIYDAPHMPALRNATLTTIAPTGTISTIADCSSGIEPLFMLAYKRLIINNEFIYTNKNFIDMAKRFNFYSEDLMKEVYKTGSIKNIRGLPLKFKEIFRNSFEIPLEVHIEMQAAFQKYTDNAVSKTINLPSSATKKDVARAFMLAYDKELKGITIFRYGSKKGTLLSYYEAD